MPVPAEWPSTKPIKIALVGEAPGSQEVRENRPFVGRAGQELDAMLRSADILRSECLVTNVFDEQPPKTERKSNDLGAWCWSLKEAKAFLKENKAIDPGWHLTKLGAGDGYLGPDYIASIFRLRDELEEAKPNIAIALGGTAFWALCQGTSIMKARGALHKSALVPGLKVLPTLHPAVFCYDESEGGVKYSWRSVAIVDLIKAKHESEWPELRLPEREVHVAGKVDDLWDFEKEYLSGFNKLLSVDIETKRGQITCIGFAPSPAVSLVVPFVRQDFSSYWSKADELIAWDFVLALLTAPHLPKLFQNGMYDIQWLWRKLRIPVANYRHDTMLMHHALYPELPKSLEFLGSVYTNERSWKKWRPRGHEGKKEE